VPLLVIDRQEVIEDRTTINKLLELGIADIIDNSTLFNLGNVNFDELIDRLRKPYFINSFKNDSYNIAKEILKFIK
jgi:hypothetical protein